MCSLRYRLRPHCHENDLSVQEEEPPAGMGLGPGLVYQLKQMRGGRKKRGKGHRRSDAIGSHSKYGYGWEMVTLIWWTRAWACKQGWLSSNSDSIA